MAAATRVWTNSASQLGGFSTELPNLYFASDNVASALCAAARTSAESS
jgi:hypothetical protein